MDEQGTFGEALPLEAQIELLRAHSAHLRARRLAALSASFEQRAIWEEWQWRRAHRGDAFPPREPPER